MKMQKCLLTGILGLVSTVSLSTTVKAQPQAAGGVLLRQTFEEGNNLWRAFGEGAKADIVREADNVKEGEAALRFDYVVDKGKLGALVMPTPQGVPTTVKSFRFWIKPDYTTSLVMVLQEGGGGRYLAIIHARQDTWQQVELSPADFILSEDANDPEDPNNKLDLNLVQAIAIGDLKQLFAQAENPDIVKLLNVENGPHTFYLDDLVVGEAPVPDVFTVADGNLEIDSFARPQLAWLPIGESSLSRAENKPANNAANNPATGHGLQVSYRQAPGVIAGFARRVPRQKFATMQRLSFDVTSLKPATLIVQVEEKGGGKYNTTVEVPGNNEMKHVDVAFKDFKAADDSKDANAQLNLDLVQQVLILDAKGLLGQAEQENTLRISKLRATVAP